MHTVKTLRFDLLDEMGERVIKANADVSDLFDPLWGGGEIARLVREINEGLLCYTYYREGDELPQLCLLRVIP